MKWINLEERKPPIGLSVAVKCTNVFVWYKEGVLENEDFLINGYKEESYHLVEWLDESEEPMFTKDEVVVLVKDILDQQKKELNSKLSSLYKDIKFKWKDH